MRRLWLLLCLLPGLALQVTAAAPPPGRRLDDQGHLLPEGARMRLGTLRLSHPTRIEALALTANGKILATCASSPNRRARLVERPDLLPRHLCVWETLTGRCLWAEEVDRYVRSLAFSRDGRLLAAGFDNSAVVWRVSTGAVALRWSRDEADIARVQFSPDDTLAVLERATRIHFIDPAGVRRDCLVEKRAARRGDFTQLFIPRLSLDGKAALWLVYERP